MRKKTAQELEKLLKEYPLTKAHKVLEKILKCKTLEELTEFEFLKLVRVITDTFLSQFYNDETPSMFKDEVLAILNNSNEKRWFNWSWHDALRVFLFGQDIAEVWFEILEAGERAMLEPLLFEYLKIEILYYNLDTKNEDLEKLVIDYFKREILKVEVS